MTPALVVIDFINDIVHPKGKIALSAERIIKNHVIEKANQAISLAREKHWPIIFVKVGFHPSYPECPKHSPLFGKSSSLGALLLGSWGTEFHEELDFHDGDLVIVKHRVNAFYATQLEAILRANHIDTLILSGVSTNMAIEHTAREGHDRDYSVIVLKDACESGSEEAHLAALASMGRIAKVITCAELRP